MKIKRFNEGESTDSEIYLQYFAEIKEIYPEFKYNTLVKTNDIYTIDFYTRHTHRFNFSKFLEIQSLINSKLQELIKVYDITQYELSVENYERATDDEIYHITGRLLIKQK